MQAIPDQELLDVAIAVGITNADTVEDIKKQARRSRNTAINELCLTQRLPHSVLYQAYAASHSVPFLQRRAINLDISLLRKLSWGMLRRNPLLPLKISSASDVPVLVISNPADYQSIEKAKQALGWHDANIAMAEQSIIEALLQKHKPKIDSLLDPSKSEFDPVFTLDEVIFSAYLNRASDIHLEPEKEGFAIRFRVDGRLVDYPDYFTLDEGNFLTSRLKVIAGLDIAESREPQDGSFTYSSKNIEFDTRVATIATVWGERSTIRLLATESEPITLESLSMNSEMFRHFNDTIRRPNGIILITGPTGSGKSSTLYAVLENIAEADTNILTVEDPVERVVENISQVQVTPKISFAGALRSFLRHDPDIIMVGEIRDGETADIALKAAMTGHLVLSTVHTNTAAAAVSRMVDLGTEPYLIGSTLLAAVAQRLVRRLCGHCRKEVAVTPEQAQALGIKVGKEEQQGSTIFEAVGCAHCLNSGYLGRIAIYEYVEIDDAVGKMIAEKLREEEWLPHSPFSWTLLDDGREKVLQGLTSYDEVRRVVRF